MSIKERIEGSVEDWRLKWGGPLGSFLGDVVSKGGQKFFLDQEPGVQEMMRDTLEQIRDFPNTPPALKKALTGALTEADIWQTVSGWIWYIVGWIPAILQAGTVQGKLIQYDVDRLAQSYRLQPFEVIQAWRRDPKTYEKYFDDLNQQGWSPDRIEALKFVTQYMPPAQDLVTWQAREVFEPKMVEKYGLDDEFEELDLTLFAKIGVTEEIAKNYWRAHWQHASFNQVVEMLRRGLMTDKDVAEWFRLVEIPPFWRPMLTEIMWNVPTRVDVRRFWDMRTIDEARLREIYLAQGYHGKDLDDYVLWTKVYTGYPDLIARWKNGHISLDDVRSELVALGMPPARVEEMIETKIKAAQPERTVKDRDLTVTDIFKGVKTGVITRVEAVDILVDLGYNEEEAIFKLEVNIPRDEEEIVEEERELSKSDIKAAVKTLLMTPAEAITRLRELRYSSADARILVDIYSALIPIEKVEKQRELAKGDIIKALIKGIIGAPEATTLLIRLRYSDEDAQFIIEANTPAPEIVVEEEARQLAKSDIRSALTIGKITAAEALSRLTGIGYTPEDAAFLVDLYQRLIPLAKVTKPREASKGDIVLGVKNGIITNSDGYQMLRDIGFSDEASEFILEVRKERSPFSPASLEEFKERASMYNKATGKSPAQKPDQLVKAADELVKITREVELLQAKVKEESAGITDAEGAPESVFAGLRKAQRTLHRAEAKLAKARTDYDSLRAAWKHGAAES